jgi:hypothetical protein
VHAASTTGIAAVRRRLERELGTTNVLTDPDALEPYARDASHGGIVLSRLRMNKVR